MLTSKNDEEREMMLRTLTMLRSDERLTVGERINCEMAAGDLEKLRTALDAAKKSLGYLSGYSSSAYIDAKDALGKSNT